MQTLIIGTFFRMDYNVGVLQLLELTADLQAGLSSRHGSLPGLASKQILNRRTLFLPEIRYEVIRNGSLITPAIGVKEAAQARSRPNQIRMNTYSAENLHHFEGWQRTQRVVHSPLPEAATSHSARRSGYPMMQRLQLRERTDTPSAHSRSDFSVSIRSPIGQR